MLPDPKFGFWMTAVDELNHELHQRELREDFVHRLAWMDVISNDLESSLAYYASLFGWTAERLDIGIGDDYRWITHGGVAVAGAEQVAVERNLSATWTVMIEVDDARPVIDAAVAAGASETFVLAPMLDLGRIAMVKDPWGATLGVWEPGTFRPSASPLQPGSLIGAVLACPDPQPVAEYYHDVFGWQNSSDGQNMNAGVAVRVEQVDGPGCFTPVLRNSSVEPSSIEVCKLTRLADPMGARFFMPN